MKTFRTSVLFVSATTLLLAFSVQDVAAYPRTKEECDAAGGAWVSNGSSGFCYLALQRENTSKACKSAGGIVLTTKNKQKICGQVRKGGGDPLKGLHLPKPDTK